MIAVIGDGSMTGGLAYEALNNAGRENTDLIVVLNDNQMSIDTNVGAISKHLNSIAYQQPGIRRLKIISNNSVIWCLLLANLPIPYWKR